MDENEKIIEDLDKRVALLEEHDRLRWGVDRWLIATIAGAVVSLLYWAVPWLMHKILP
jgi:tetrahydromethanopterin S-methyltransferase subunit F